MGKKKGGGVLVSSTKWTPSPSLQEAHCLRERLRLVVEELVLLDYEGNFLTPIQEHSWNPDGTDLQILITGMHPYFEPKQFKVYVLCRSVETEFVRNDVKEAFRAQSLELTIERVQTLSIRGKSMTECCFALEDLQPEGSRLDTV